MHTPPVAEDQWGLFTRAQAFESGWTNGSLHRATKSGRLQTLVPGVYVASSRLAGLSRRNRHLLVARALTIAYGDSWHLARRTAAIAYGLPLLGRAPSEVQLSRALSGNTQSPSRHRRVLGLPASEQTVVHDLPCTSVARTVFDLARSESFRSAVVAADAAVRSGVTREELLTVLEAHRGWPGTRRARDVILFADGRAESPLESLGRVTCLEEGLPVFEPQVEVYVDGVFIARVDGLWREQLVVFEGDGATKFTDAGVLPSLLGRQEQIRDAGLDVVRAGWSDVTRRREPFAARVRRRFAERSAATLPPRVQLRSTAVRVTPLVNTDHYTWPPLPFETSRAGRGGRAPERSVAEGSERDVA